MIVQDEVSFVKVKNGSDGSAGSNGKDGANGKDSNMHTAYSWSADGTDRFTDKYPNENLWVITDAISGYVDSNSGNIMSSQASCHKSINTLVNVSNSEAKYLIMQRWNPNKIVNTTNSNRIVFLDKDNKVLRVDNLPYLTTDGTYIYREYKIPDSTVNIRLGAILGPTQGSLDTSILIKFELSSEPTIYTPSPQDDFNNAWPTYSGTYSSHDKVQSQNPKDYTWARIRGADGLDGKDGQTPKDVISGYLSNEAIIVPATPTGAVTDYSKAFGDFTVFEGQDKKNSGVTYSKISEVNMTSTINSAGRYVVTALSADTGTATYRATYAGVTVDKVLIVVKNKQGPSGAKGDRGKDGIAGKDGVGLKETIIRYASSTSGGVAPTNGWQSTVPTVAPGDFLWTRTTWAYTDNTSEDGYSVSRIGEDGNTGKDGIAGKDGVGIEDTTITYVGSTNGTTPPSTGWTSTIPTVVDGSYLWTKTVWLYTDKTSETGYSVAKMGVQGEKGDKGAKGEKGPQGDPTGITVSPTAPTNPYINMLWQNTGSNNGYLTGTVYQWNGVKWNTFIFSAENIVANSLSALSAYLGDVKGGSITGSKIKTDEKIVENYGDGEDMLVHHEISDFFYSVGKSATGKTYSENVVDIKGISGNVDAPGGYKTWMLGAQGFGVTQGKYFLNFGGGGFRMTLDNFEVSHDDLKSYDSTQLSPASGFSVYSTNDENLPRARRFGKTVTLSGAFTNNNNIEKGWRGVIGYLPRWATPSVMHRVICQGSGSNTFYLQVKPNGELFLERYGTTDTVAFNSGAWLTINTTYLV